MQKKRDVATWQAQVYDLGVIAPESDGHQLLWPGIYAIDSLYDGETLRVPAQGLLEIAAYVERNRAKLEQEAATPEALELAADAQQRHKRATFSQKEHNA